MKIRRWLVLLGLLLTVAIAVKESREPYLWLYVDDLLHPKPQPRTLSLSKDLAVRLYADPRPHTGKVARLQKGLALVVDEQERIEEGFGFGLPLIEVNGRAYLSRSASVWQMGNTLVKRYEMDTLDTPSGFLRRKYEPVSSIGSVTASYTVTAGEIEVMVDFSGLETSWDRAYLMNEQGARLFTRYEEPGLAVEGEQLGHWQPTTAQQGCIVAADRSVHFCVTTEKKSPRYYGRERYTQYYWVGLYFLSWAGIDIELNQPVSHFEYRIAVGRQSHD